MVQKPDSDFMARNNKHPLKCSYLSITEGDMKDVKVVSGCKKKLFSVGIKAEKFAPVSAEQRKMLKQKYGFDPSKPLVIHVGHCSKGRGLEDFAKIHTAQRMVVASGMFEDENVVRILNEAKVKIHKGYLENVEEVYQMADAYLFPTRSAEFVISIPLSVMEALSCGVPVIGYQHTEKPRKWSLEGTLPQSVSITSIQTKSFVGGIEKSFLYDNIVKSAKREDQVDYVQRQAHKIQQKPQEGNRKLRYSLTRNELAVVNQILDACFQSIEIIRHRFFSGTWATNILFQNESNFCEYNSGSGEFLVATIVREVEKAPNNSIVLIDEPEVSLHPRAQYRLVEYFFDAIKRKHIQMIVTTHSEHIVEMLPMMPATHCWNCVRKLA